MTQRTEARFKVFSRANNSVFSTFNYNIIDFNVGGTYDTTTYEYTVDNSGTYLMGYSYTKRNPYTGTNPFIGASNVRLTRGDTTYTISDTRMIGQGYANTTLGNCFVYRFEAGDKLKVVTAGGQPRMNRSAYSGNNIFNPWWGIKLNY